MVLKKPTIQTHTRMCVCDEIASWRRLEHYAVEYRWMQLLFIIALCWFSFVLNLFFFAVIMVWLLLLKLKCFQINSFICSYTRTAAEKKDERWIYQKNIKILCIEIIIAVILLLCDGLLFWSAWVWVRFDDSFIREFCFFLCAN